MGLPDWLAGTDIYLIDQILRGRLDSCTSVLDAGCGKARNLIGLARAGVDVRAVDRDEARVAKAMEALAAAGCSDVDTVVQVAEVDALPFDDNSFDVVICSAVLHFARDTAHFDAMVDELWRVLAPDGLLFTRLASSIGLEGRIEVADDGGDGAGVEGEAQTDREGAVASGDAPTHVANNGMTGACRRYRLPDGTDRYLVNEALLLATTERLGGILADPIKTTNVQGQRCMTTWCVRRPVP